MRRGLPNVSTVNAESVPTTSIFLSSVCPSVSTLRSIGIREEFQVLIDLADHSKSLVISQPVNRVLRLEFRSASRIDPL